MMLRTFLSIYLLCLTACSTAFDTTPFIPKPTNGDMAGVYIYRPSAMSNAFYSPELLVNGEYKMPIKNGRSSLLTLAPGKYMFEIEPDKNYSGLTQLSLTMVAGHTYYIRVDTALKIKSTANYQPYRRNFNLVSVDESLAIDQIEQCCTSKNTNSTEQVALPEKEKPPIEGFFVDKTQNPFSH